MTATSGRLLKLLSLLQTRRDWPGEELARRLEVSGRTIRRDIERLRELGYPVDALTGPAGGYRLHAGTAMPPLLLDDDEAVAIAVGLRTAARASVTGIEETSVRALVKLEQVLPSHLRRRVNALQTATVTLATSGGPTVDPETLTAIAGACRDRERLRFDYRGRDATETQPHRRAAHAGEPGPALVPRGLGLRPRATGGPSASTASRASPRRARASSPARCPTTTRRPSWRRTSRARRRAIRPASPCSPRPRRWPSAALFTGSTVEAIDERTCELRTSDDSLDWLAVRVAMLGVDFEVHEPPELVERVRELAARFERAAGAALASRGWRWHPVAGSSVAGGSCRRTRPQTPQAPSEGRVPPPPARTPSLPGRAPPPATRSASVYSFAAAAPAAGRCAGALRRSIAPPWSASALASQRVRCVAPRTRLRRSWAPHVAAERRLPRGRRSGQPQSDGRSVAWSAPNDLSDDRSGIEKLSRPGSRSVPPMKTMTCKQLGGPCDVEHHGKDHNEVIKAQDRHLKAQVAAGDETHREAHEAMRGRWKRPVSGLGWYRDVKREFASLPDDA